ncbi:UNVERIFIED_CONTAM: hypothetical protein FKN15_012431 [Acipenser sinensis]
MAINGRVYLYNTEDFTWRAAKGTANEGGGDQTASKAGFISMQRECMCLAVLGVESMVTEISSYQCCFSEDPSCMNAFINVGCPPDKHIKVLRKTYDPQYLYRQDSAAEDLRVLYSFVDLQCPLLVYVDDPWLPLLELWEGKTFVEFVPADFVMFEVHGMYNYEYQQSARSAGCVSQPQTWRSMLKTQSRPNPHTAWNRKNYVSCKDPSGPPLTSPELEYEVLKAGSGNMVMFPSYNGFYIFKAIVVDPTYSFCELSVTFSVYVYGAFPEAKFDSPLTLVVFLAIFAGIMLVGFYLPWFLLKRPNP